MEILVQFLMNGRKHRPVGKVAPPLQSVFKTVLTAALTVMSGLDPHSIRNMIGMVGLVGHGWTWLDLVGFGWTWMVGLGWLDLDGWTLDVGLWVGIHLVK